MPATKSEKILIIDDDRMYSRLAIEVLNGWQRMTADTAARGVGLFATETPDIVFLDIGLPDASGLDVLAHMKRLRPTAFVVICTTSRVAEDVERARYLGAAGYVIKPFTRGKLRGYLDLYREYCARMASLTETELHGLQQECFARAEQVPSAFDTDTEERDARWLERQEVVKHWRILYLDDDRLAGQRVIEGLGRLGCQISHSEIETDLPAMLAHLNPDVIFLQNELRDRGGVALIREFRKSGLEMPIIVITSDKLLPSDPYVRSLGIAEFLIKPVRFPVMKQALMHQAGLALKRQEDAYVR